MKNDLYTFAGACKGACEAILQYNEHNIDYNIDFYEVIKKLKTFIYKQILSSLSLSTTQSKKSFLKESFHNFSLL